MEKLLFIAKTVLPISSPPISDGGVFVVEGEIKEVGEAKRLKKKYPGVPKRDLGGGILLPGFVNAHVHLELGWMKDLIGEIKGFMEWLERIVMIKMDGTTEEKIKKSVGEGVEALIQSGVTTLGEISSYGLDRDALKKKGLRTVLFSELFDRHGDFWEVFHFEEGNLFYERPFPHAPYSCSPDCLKKVLDFSYNKEIPIGIHLAESRDEVKFVRGEENGFEKRIYLMVGREPFTREKAPTPFQYLKNLGFFKNTKVTATHMVQVKTEEIKEFKSLNIGVVLCPRSNYLLKVGFPPVKEYLVLERIGIGTDGLSSNWSLDFFDELRFFYETFSKELGENASFFTVYLATLGGAKALFLEDKIGSLNAGKEADLIYITPSNSYQDPFRSVIYSQKEDIKLVIVNGKELSSKM